MDALHLRKRSLLTALCAAVAVSLCSTTIAQAQTVPAAAPDVPVAAAVTEATPATAAAPTTAAPATATQAAPATQTAQANPAPRPPAARPAPAPKPLWFVPIIDFVVTFTQPAYYNSTPGILAPASPSGGTNQLPAYSPFDLGGTVRFPISPKFNLYFDRITEGTINQPLERSYVFTPGPAHTSESCVTTACTATYPKDTRDILLQYHGTWTFNRFLSMDGGLSFRHRVWASGTGTPQNGFPLFTTISAQPYPYTLASQEHHMGYLGFNYTTKPMKEFMNSVFVFTEQFQTQAVDHNVAILCSAALIAAGTNGCAGKIAALSQVGYLDERPGTQRYYTSTQGVTWIWPVDPRHGVTFTLNERFGYLNWYENNPSPLRWNSALVYQLAKRFSPGFTLAVRHQDLHQTANGATFAVPNAIHVGSWDLLATFHVDPNSWR